MLILEIPDLSATIFEFSKYGILGILLILFIYVIIYLYKQNKVTADNAVERAQSIETEFKLHLKDTNEKLFEIVKENTAAYKLLTEAFEKNTIVNDKFSQMVEKKLDLMDLLKKNK